MSTVIEISGLTKKYGSNKAVNDISFKVSKGEILGFLGPNGAGKSTTMNILTGYLSKTSGKVSVCGFDILDNPKEAKRKIGYLPEHPPVYNEMTPMEYLDFVCDLKGVKEMKKEHIELVMAQVGITHMQSRLIRNLSKGYKQRVGLAGALIGNPEVLVLDEPTVGLDPTQIIEIRNVIKQLGKERTVILSTHILQEVTALCDRVIIINHGKIVAADTLENLSGGDTNTYKLKIKGDRNRINELVSNTDFIGTHIIGNENENGVYNVEISAKNDEDIRENIFHLFVDDGMMILAFEKLKSTLEDVFVRVTNDSSLVVSEEEDEKELSFIEKVKNIFVKKNEDAEEIKENSAKEEKKDLSEYVQMPKEEQEKEDEE